MWVLRWIFYLGSANKYCVFQICFFTNNLILVRIEVNVSSLDVRILKKWRLELNFTFE